MKRQVILISAISLLLIAAVVFMIPRRKSVERTAQMEKETFLPEAARILSQGDILSAREVYKEAFARESDLKDMEKLREIIEDLNMKILFSPIMDECSHEYTVKSGDVLVNIARRFNTTVGLIKRANNLTSDIIRPGQKLKINKCGFSIVVDKTENKLFLKTNNEVLKTYNVSTGVEDKTPIGNFKIVNKLVDPTWYRAGMIIPPDSPENILGTRWLGFDLSGYGIHGTTEPEYLGQHVTMGCVRMRNKEVEELFDIVPVGTEVAVLE